MLASTRRVLAYLAAVTFTAFAPASRAALTGIAGGKLAVIDNSDTAYGFSAYSGGWTQTSLDSPIVSRKVGQFIAYLRSSGKLYTYNPTGDRWVKTSYTGPVLGEDAQSSTAIVWTPSGAWASATLWTIWKWQGFGGSNMPRGGGSAGTFGAVWCDQFAYAYNPANGNWHSVALGAPPIGGIARDGLGLVWTFTDAFAFDSGSSTWNALDLGNPAGVSAAGSGKVGLVWGNDVGTAFSAHLDEWYEITTPDGWLGGAASGDVALLWTASEAHAFDATTGLWSQILLSAAAVDDGATADGSAFAAGFSVAPNPSLGGEVTFTIPFSGGDWSLSVFDVSGARVAEVPGPRASLDGGPDRVVWEPRSAGGERLAAGTYWAVAEDGQSREARRFVLLEGR